MIVKCKACGNSFDHDANKSCPFCGSSSFLTTEKIGELEQRRQDDMYERIHAKEKIQEQRNSFIKLIIGACVGILLLIIISISFFSMSINKARLNKYNNAIALMEQGDYEEASAEFQKLGNYSDAKQYLEKIDMLISERNTAYKNGKEYYENARYDMAINEFIKCKNYEDSNDYINKASNAIYDQAQTEYDSGNYEKAKNLLSLIPENVDIYSKSVVLSTNVDNEIQAQKNADNYAIAVSKYENGEYEEAQKYFIQLDNYSDSSKYLTDIGSILYSKAEECLTNNEIAEGVRILDLIDEESEWNQYSIAVELRQKTVDDYLDNLQENATAIYKKEGLDALNSYLTENTQPFISTETISSIKNDIMQNNQPVQPVSLLDVHVFKTENSNGNLYIDDWIKGKDYDNLGNSDYSGIKYYVSYTKPAWETCTYLIDAEYYTLSGYFSLHEDFKDKTDESNWAVLSIYGDGVCLYTSPTLRGGVQPISFSIDISGVKELQYKVEAQGHLRFGILNPTLQ